nr:hypothetical protein [Cutibacterium granulosum]
MRRTDPAKPARRQTGRVEGGQGGEHGDEGSDDDDTAAEHRRGIAV